MLFGSKKIEMNKKLVRHQIDDEIIKTSSLIEEYKK